MIEVSIIVINYNTFQLTCDAIQSIYDQVRNVAFEIILIDNASTEGDVSKFSRKFPGIKIVASKENVGFAKGNNLGIKHSKGKAILLLNSDTRLLNNSVSISLNYLDQNHSVAAVTGRLEFEDGTIQHNCQRFPSITAKIFELLRLQKMVSKKVGGRILQGAFFGYHEQIFPDWIWGTYFMFKREALAILPKRKLAEDFFMYGEDMQWCKDFALLGKRVAFLPEARIMHLMGKSDGAKEELIDRHLELFLEKYYPRWHRKAIKLLDYLLIHF
jgi:GT2 family glycosyltransferase